MHNTTPAALAVIRPHNTDAPSVINLAEEFQRLQHEYEDINGGKFERAIQSKLLEQRKAFIHHLESMFSEINDVSNRKIQETNAKFGFTLPLEELKKVSSSNITEHDRRFIATERESAAVQKKHLKERLEVRIDYTTFMIRIKFQISSALGITVTADPSSLTRTTESPDNTVEIAQLLKSNRSLQNELEVSKQTVIKLEDEKKQDKTIIARWQFLHYENRQENATLKEELKHLKENISHYEVVANSCSRVRHGLSHKGRCFRNNDRFHDIEGRPPADRKVIDRRKNACHQGDIAVDFSLFMIDPNRAGWNIGGERYMDFTSSYRVTPHQWAKILEDSKARPDRVLLEVLNMHGTMYRCYANTEYTHSPQNDVTFNVLFAKLFKRYKDLLATANQFPSATRYENLVTFVKQAANDRGKLREIVRRTVAHEKARCFEQARVISPYSLPRRSQYNAAGFESAKGGQSWW
ncbi:uncharacterized protein EAF02_011877 [Botrytis sinoallii]|uniref:uncharacterized protein n=1 Tax=Botrytis sinoallii TaxID=1463999 RepID=UPI0018FFA212|nr:uncharacterized protein EAF02_011877 [Botrytis sinoallii]KAF7853572.1 hypothetical protein EAF02_011877 [Botrytis sinoallii]